MERELVVYRDFIESNGAWRLFWLDPGSTIGVNDESTVTGSPHHKTMRAAIATGQRKHGVKARRVTAADGWASY